MKINKDIDELIKRHYTGSIVSFSDDIGRFFSVKRILKKQLVKNGLNQNPHNVRLLANHIQILFNFFTEELTCEIFEEILDEEECILWSSVLHVIGKQDISYNKEFEQFLRENL